MKTLKKSGTIHFQDYIALVCMFGIIILLSWKLPYGFGFQDESWYLTFGHRYSLGDAMVADEWNIIQLFSFFLYLPVKLFMAVRGSTEGIILAFRYLFLVYYSAASAVVYLLTRKYGPISIAVLVIFFLHIPAGVMAVCYYTLTPSLSIIIGLLLLSGNLKKPTLFVIGLLFAGLVLANPFFAVFYLLFCLSAMIFSRYQKKRPRTFQYFENYLSVRSWVWITLGIFVLAAAFFYFIVSRSTISELLANIPRAFDDSAYNVFHSPEKKQNIISIKKSITELVTINPYLLSIYAIIFTMMVSDKKRISRRLVYISAAAINTIVFMLYLAIASEFLKYLIFMLPLAVFGLFCYMLSEKKNKKVFVFLWVWGVVVAFFEDIATEQVTHLMNLGLILSVTATAIFIKNLIDEIRRQTRSQINKRKVSDNRLPGSKIVTVLLAAVFAVQIGCQLYFITNLKILSNEYFYHDIMNLAPITQKLDVTIQKGPAKGLITTAETDSIYNSMLNDLSLIKEEGRGAVLILGELPWTYLYTEKPYGIYTTWYLKDEFQETTQRLAKYYDLHPDKIPEYIYIPNNFALFISSDVWKAISANDVNYPAEALSYFTKLYNCSVIKGEIGYILKNLDWVVSDKS